MMYNMKTGETFDINDVSAFEMVTPEGEVKETIDVKHDTRSLLNLVNKGMFSDYDYMPVTSKDIAQMTALNMETDSGTYGMMRLIAGVGGAIGFGTAGAGMGLMAANLGIEMYEVAKNNVLAGNPKDFWNKFVNNVNEIKESDDSFMRFLDGAGMGSSYFSAGASESLYKDWGDMLDQNGWYTAGAIAGTITRVTASIAAFGGLTPELSATQSWANVSNGLITDISLSEGLADCGKRVGNGMEVYEAAKLGTLVGLSSGVAAAFTLKAVPWMARTMAPEIAKAFSTSSMVNALANGAENAAWYGLSQTLASIATGEERPIEPLTTGIMFGAGFGLSYLGHKFSTRGFQDEAVDKLDIRNLPDEVFFDNTKKQLSKDETIEISRAMLARDRMMNNQYADAQSFNKAVKEEYAFAKSINLSDNSAEEITKNYASRAQYMDMKRYAEAAKTGNKMGASPYADKMSLAAKDVMEENFTLLTKLGLANDEIEAIASIAYENAASKTKGQVGNYEIRKAFNEVLGGLL